MAGRQGQVSAGYSEEEWNRLLMDPVREELLARGEAPDLDRIRALFPPTTGDPAFDPGRVARLVERLETDPAVDTGHPFLDLSVKTGLAHIDLTFQGDHPKYGAKRYAEDIHDGFPPTIIAAVDALSAWGLHARAAQLFRYWLAHFVRADGTIDYYGPSIGEYGMLLATADLLLARAGGEGWWEAGLPALDRLAQHLLRLREQAEGADGLLSGVPEADTRKDVGRYFHNNAWAARGLSRWAEACERVSASPATSAATMRSVASAIAADTLAAIARTWPRDADDWWLSPQVEPALRPEFLTASTLGSYTNYRYWPELLSSGLLPGDLAHRVVESRLRAGGQFCGMTRLANGLDDWPLAEYLAGLWRLGRRGPPSPRLRRLATPGAACPAKLPGSVAGEDFLLSLYGHVAYHQAGGHLTAYEQISAPPFRERAPYCLPAQLVAARAARLLVAEKARPSPCSPSVDG